MAHSSLFKSMMGGPIGEWALLAKYLVNEATEDERLRAETLLRKNEDLRNDFKKLMVSYYFNDVPEQVEPVLFFDKLNSRIKKTNH